MRVEAIDSGWHSIAEPEVPGTSRLEGHTQKPENSLWSGWAVWIKNAYRMGMQSRSDTEPLWWKRENRSATILVFLKQSSGVVRGRNVRGTDCLLPGSSVGSPCGLIRLHSQSLFPHLSKGDSVRPLTSPQQRELIANRVNSSLPPKALFRGYGEQASLCLPMKMFVFLW